MGQAFGRAVKLLFETSPSWIRMPGFEPQLCSFLASWEGAGDDPSRTDPADLHGRSQVRSGLPGSAWPRLGCRKHLLGANQQTGTPLLVYLPVSLFFHGDNEKNKIE